MIYVVWAAGVLVFLAWLGAGVMLLADDFGPWGKVAGVVLLLSWLATLFAVIDHGDDKAPCAVWGDPVIIKGVPHRHCAERYVPASEVGEP